MFVHLAVFAPRKLYAGQPEAYAGAAEWCAGGTAWEWDGVYFEFLTPPRNSEADDNEQSCVLRVLVLLLNRTFRLITVCC